MSYYIKDIIPKDILSIKTSHPEIFQSFKSGSKEGLKRIFEIMCTPLIVYCTNKMGWFGLTSVLDAEDIVSNAFLKLHMRREDIKSGNHLVRFLYTVCRNHITDLGRQKISDLKYKNYKAYSEEEDDSSISDQCHMEKDRLAAIYKAVENLPRMQKNVFKAYFLDLKQTPEIVNDLKIDSQTVLNHKTKAIANVRKYIQERPIHMLDSTSSEVPAKSGNNAKKVRCITTGEVFDSIKEAAASKYLNPCTVGKIIKGIFTREPKYLFELV